VVKLAELARELDVDARTLRRAAAEGTIRCDRTSARRLLLLQAIDEGRLVLDRDEEWRELKAHRGETARRARGAHASRRRRAHASVLELLASE
jgi:hypothetical protein